MENKPMRAVLSRLLVVLAVLGLLAGSTASAGAAPPPKTASVALSPATATLTVGQTLDLTATTLKQGSAYSDGWSGAAKLGTVLNADGYYVSTARFTAAAPGTYLVTYHITMTAGRSDVAWQGQASATITVVAPRTHAPNCGVGQGAGQGYDNGKTNGACAQG
jgi:uncharacterized protein YjdB